MNRSDSGIITASALRALELHARRGFVRLPSDPSVPILADGLVRHDLRYEYKLCGQFYFRSVNTLDQNDNLLRLFSDLETQSIDEVLSHLQGGSFSLVILDHRDRTLTLATDRYGLQPLYFSAKSTAGGSEIHFSEFLDVWSDFQKDSVSMLEFMHYGCLFFSDSMNLGVSRLQRGAYAIVSGTSGLMMRNWWTLFAHAVDTATPVLSDLIEGVDEAFRSFFGKVPVDKGAIAGLSGGFDSRLVVSYLAQFGIKPLRTLTMGARRSEEATSAEAVARLVGGSHVLRQVPDELIASNGAEISHLLHLSASLEVAHVGFLRSLVFEAVEAAPEASYFDGFLGDVVMGGTYFSGAARTIGEMILDVSHTEYKLTPLESIDRYLGIAVNAKQRINDPLLADFLGVDEPLTEMQSRVLEAIKPLYEISGSHQEMVNLMRLHQRGYRYITCGPRSLLAAAPVYLPFMDYSVRDALDRVPLHWLARHRFYRAFLREKFPAVSRIPKAYNGATAQSSDTVYRLRQYGSGFMRHLIYPWLYRLSLGTIDLKPEYMSVQNYLSNSSNQNWIERTARDHLSPAMMAKFSQLNPLVKFRLISLWLSGYSLA